MRKILLAAIMLSSLSLPSLAAPADPDIISLSVAVDRLDHHHRIGLRVLTGTSATAKAENVHPIIGKLSTAPTKASAVVEEVTTGLVITVEPWRVTNDIVVLRLDIDHTALLGLESRSAADDSQAMAQVPVIATHASEHDRWIKLERGVPTMVRIGSDDVTLEF